MDAPSTVAAATTTTTKPAQRITSALDTRSCADTVTFDFEDFIKSKLNLNLTHTPSTAKSRLLP
ncbi:hypothetical protein GGI21_004237, partial [Coemansia aciculifera]